MQGYRSALIVEATVDTIKPNLPHLGEETPCATPAVGTVFDGRGITVVRVSWEQARQGDRDVRDKCEADDVSAKHYLQGGINCPDRTTSKQDPKCGRRTCGVPFVLRKGLGDAIDGNDQQACAGNEEKASSAGLEAELEVSRGQGEEADGDERYASVSVTTMK